jgi:hypothetical protein
VAFDELGVDFSLIGGTGNRIELVLVESKVMNDDRNPVLGTSEASSTVRERLITETRISQNEFSPSP